MSESPLMTSAWADFLQFAIAEPELHKAFQRETGGAFLSPPKDAFEAMIDRATGALEETVEQFVFWVTWSQWGELGVPDAILKKIAEAPWSRRQSPPDREPSV